MKTAHCDMKKAHWAVFQPNISWKKTAQCLNPEKKKPIGLFFSPLGCFSAH